MTWHDLITTQFHNKLPGGSSNDPHIENPLRVGHVIAGTNADLLISRPLTTLLNRPNSYKPRLLEEPTIEELEEISPIFHGNILPIAAWLFDAQILPSYRKSWLPEGPPILYPNTPSGMATTTTEIKFLQHTHRKTADDKIHILQQELLELHTMDDVELDPEQVS